MLTTIGSRSCKEILCSRIASYLTESVKTHHRQQGQEGESYVQYKNDLYGFTVELFEGSAFGDIITERVDLEANLEELAYMVLISDTAQDFDNEVLSRSLTLKEPKSTHPPTESVLRLVK